MSKSYESVVKATVSRMLAMGHNRMAIEASLPELADAFNELRAKEKGKPSSVPYAGHKIGFLAEVS